MHISQLRLAVCHSARVGSRTGGDLRAIAIVQSIRVVVIAVGLPAGLSVFGLVGHAPPRATAPLSIAVLDELAILVAVSSVVAIIAYRFRFSRRTALRSDDVLRHIAWQRNGPRDHALVGREYGNGRDGRGYWFALCQYAITPIAEFYYRGVWFVRGGCGDSRISSPRC